MVSVPDARSVSRCMRPRRGTQSRQQLASSKYSFLAAFFTSAYRLHLLLLPGPPPARSRSAAPLPGASLRRRARAAGASPLSVSFCLLPFTFCLLPLFVSKGDHRIHSGRAEWRDVTRGERDCGEQRARRSERQRIQSTDAV